MEKFITDKFGYTIAFLLPGFLAILGLRHYYSPFDIWLNTAVNIGQGISGFMYIIMTSLSLGIIISAIRWIIFDRLLFKKISDRIAKLDYSKLLSERFDAYMYIKEAHYHFYQFYANIAVSLFILSVLLVCYYKIMSWIFIFIFLILEIILICGSKNCLNNLYSKAEALQR